MARPMVKKKGEKKISPIVDPTISSTLLKKSLSTYAFTSLSKSKEVKYNCPKCGDEGILEIIYDYSKIKNDFNQESLKKNKEFSMWRYLPLLPVDDITKIGPLKVGWSPLLYIL